MKSYREFLYLGDCRYMYAVDILSRLASTSAFLKKLGRVSISDTYKRLVAVDYYAL